MAGLSVGVSVASRFVYTLQTVTETETSKVVTSGGALEEPCFSTQPDARLFEKRRATEKPGSDSLRTL